MDNLPYPTAFDEEESSSSHPTVIKPSDYHIDEETIVKSDENEEKRKEEKSEDAKSDEVENEENCREESEKDAEITDQADGTLGEIGAILKNVNQKLVTDEEKDAEEPDASGEANSPSEGKCDTADHPTSENTQQPSSNRGTGHSEATRDQFDGPELTTAQFNDAFPHASLYMPVCIQYNPDAEQYQEHSTSAEQYQSQMAQNYYRSYGNQQIIAQRSYNQATTVMSSNQQRRQQTQQNYNQENISPQQQQYTQRLQSIGIPTPAPEILAQYERQQQDHQQQQQQPQSQKQQQSDMYMHGSAESGVDMNIPVSCCVNPYSTNPIAPQDSMGRQPARIVNGKKVHTESLYV